MPEKNVHFSSASNEWCSPDVVLERVYAVFGKVDLDPCSNLGIANVRAENYFTVNDDGLRKTWFGNVYMNPPYGREISRWVDKAYASYRKGDVNAVIALLPARTDTYWFLKLSNFHCCFIMGRLKFVGATSSAPFPSAAFFIGDYPETFDREFSKIGNVYALVRGWG